MEDAAIVVSALYERLHDPAVPAADVRQPHEGHNHLGPIKPCFDRLPSFPGVRADPGSSESRREQEGSLRCAYLRCKHRYELFEEQGYTTLAPGWPDDPDTVEEAKHDPEVFAHKRLKQVTDHYIDAIGQLTRKPAVIGHSFGGLLAQRVAGEGVAAVTVAIAPAPFRGVLPLPLPALKSSLAVLGNPLNYTRAVPLTMDEAHCCFAQ